MNAVDASEHYDKPSNEQTPSLLTIILDTNPAAWSLLSSTLSLSSALANLLVFINAHLACNYTNKVAVIASHVDKAQWLYPYPPEQLSQPPARSKRGNEANGTTNSDQSSEPTKRLKLNGPRESDQNGVSLNTKDVSSLLPPSSSGSKYRPFRLVEEEVIKNLTLLLSTTSPDAVKSTTSTKIAGALTLALSYINRESIAYAESLTGVNSVADPSGNPTAMADTNKSSSNSLESRILLVSASPSADLAHQYIPIMNAIFACQRLAIPIDVLHLPHPGSSSTNQNIKSASKSIESPSDTQADSTVFLQQAADATHGIFIPVHLDPTTISPSSTSRTTTTTTTISSQSFLTYLLTAFLPSPRTRTHLILPTRIDVDFRAACFCHRKIVSVGFVCSICLSIFCSVPENADCLTCGTHLKLGEYGNRPVVVPPRKTKKKKARISVE